MRFAPLFLLGLAVAAPAAAHHGWGSYDADKPMTIVGPVRDIALLNMNARGATPDRLPVGASVTAYGYPKRDDMAEIRAEWVEGGGERFQLR